jgi:hypothetical protein
VSSAVSRVFLAETSSADWTKRMVAARPTLSIDGTKSAGDAPPARAQAATRPIRRDAPGAWRRTAPARLAGHSRMASCMACKTHASVDQYGVMHPAHDAVRRWKRGPSRRSAQAGRSARAGRSPQAGTSCGSISFSGASSGTTSFPGASANRCKSRYWNPSQTISRRAASGSSSTSIGEIRIGSSSS